jgi:hypothetical protein
MWRLLPVLLLVSCALAQPEGENQAESFRIISSFELPLRPLPPVGTEPRLKEFRGDDTLGQLTESGDWNYRHLVTHSRLRCATYQTGIQFGAGDQGCTEVNWLSEVEFGSTRTQCNNAPVNHRSRGAISMDTEVFKRTNCVRIVTRCAGPC